MDHYEILGIARDASEEEIRKAVRNERRSWIGKQNAPTLERQNEAALRLRQIGEAETTLLDPAKRAAYDRTLTNQPKRPAQATAGSGEPARSSADWVARAMEFHRSGDYQSAGYAAREACHADPNSAVAWWIRADSSARLGRAQDAAFEFAECTRLDPTSTAMLIDYANFKKATGDLAGAFRLLQQAWDLEPENAEIHLAMADCYLAGDKPDKALPLVKELAEASPADESLQYYLAQVYYSMVMARLTEADEDYYLVTSAEQAEFAREHLDRALDLNFNDAELRSELRDKRNWITQSVSTTRVPSSNGAVWAGAFAVAAVMIAAYGLGFLLLGGLGYAYYQRHWLPQWEVNRRLANRTGVLRWGIGPR